MTARMTTRTTDWTDPAAILEALDHARAAPATRPEPLRDLEHAQAILDTITELRRQRGETPRGYKIGFTNRTIWPRYGVFAPIWARVGPSTPVRSVAIGASVEVLAGRVRAR